MLTSLEEQELSFANTGDISQISYDGGLGAGFYLGYDLTNTFSVEAEINMKENSLTNTNLNNILDKSKGTNRSYAYMLNGYYKPHLLSFGDFRGYLGAGAGYTGGEIEDFSKDDTLGWQAMAGIYFERSFGDIRVGYKYLSAEGLEYIDGTNNTKIDNISHNVEFTTLFNW